jgi:ribonuclease III
VKLGADLLAFQGRIGHVFRQPDLLVRALTHASISGPNRVSNERLEFLGDRVLALTMADALSEADAKAAEGQLAPRLNALVRLETCAEVARGAGLGDVLKLGRSEMISGGRRKEALLGDALEAVIAAVYLDAGFEAARGVVLHLWGARIAEVSLGDARDAKSALQEWAQGRGLPPPAYTELSRSGPDHQPQFQVEVQIEGHGRAEAAANTKRAAEQMAARQLLDVLEKKDD